MLSRRGHLPSERSAPCCGDSDAADDGQRQTWYDRERAHRGELDDRDDRNGCEVEEIMNERLFLGNIGLGQEEEAVVAPAVAASAGYRGLRRKARRSRQVERRLVVCASTKRSTRAVLALSGAAR